MRYRIATQTCFGQSVLPLSLHASSAGLQISGNDRYASCNIKKSFRYGPLSFLSPRTLCVRLDDDAMF